MSRKIEYFSCSKNFFPPKSIKPNIIKIIELKVKDFEKGN